MKLSDYQDLCQKTASKGMDKEKEIMTWGLGVAGEAGDLVGCIKKTHSHDDDQREGARENIGDTMWYIAMICNYYGWDLGDILKENIVKLRKRYKSGKFTLKEARRNNKRIDWNE